MQYNKATIKILSSLSLLSVVFVDNRTAEQVSGSLLSFHSGTVRLSHSKLKYFFKAKSYTIKCYPTESVANAYIHKKLQLKLMSPALCHQKLGKYILKS